MAKNNEKFVSRENAKTLWGYMVDLLTGKQNKLTFDETPTQSSDNPVKSGGIFTALAGKGTYSKPQNGIPKTDLENAVQTSLGLADSALQSETDPTVPSWAKQSSKPSYNSDEISDTSRDHKFATQAQLNQISTNQTNILYGLNTGVKNKLPCKISNNNQSNDTGLKCNYNEDGTYTVTGTKSTSDSYLDIENIYADKLNGDHVAYISVTGTGTCQIAAYGWNGTGYTLMLSTSTSQGFNIGNYAHVLFRIRFMDSVGTSYNATVKAMVCTMEAWNQSHDWQPPALPNQDLTVLEAEDRAALVEVVDSGAKNKAEIYSTSANSINISVSGYTATFSGTSSATGSIEWCNIHVDKTGSYILYYKMSTAAGRFTVKNKTDGTNLGDYYNTKNETPIVLSLTAGKNYVISSWFASGSASACAIDIMICTSVEFKVSPKLVPYRLSYNTLGKLKKKQYNIELSSVTFTKSYGGVYYYLKDVTDDFSEVISVTIRGFQAVPNKGYTPYTENGTTVGLMVYDADAPATLTFSDGRIYLNVVGYAK